MYQNFHTCIPSLFPHHLNFYNKWRNKKLPKVVRQFWNEARRFESFKSASRSRNVNLNSRNKKPLFAFYRASSEHLVNSTEGTRVWEKHIYSAVIAFLEVVHLIEDHLILFAEDYVPKEKEIKVLTLYILTLVCMFSIRFSLHFLGCWKGEFI